MELNNKEKKIKQVLSELDYQVDTDFLWKEVDKELNKEKRKRRFFWIFPLLGVGLVALVLFNQNPKDDRMLTETVEQVKITNAIEDKKLNESSISINNNQNITTENQQLNKVKEAINNQSKKHTSQSSLPNSLELLIS